MKPQKPIEVRVPKFTPGPWALDASDSPLIINGPENDGPDVVAIVKDSTDGGTYSYPPDVAYANARLIAAAPELYAEALWVVRLFGTDHPKGLTELKEHVANLRALLGRVEGETETADQDDDGPGETPQSGDARYWNPAGGADR